MESNSTKIAVFIGIVLAIILIGGYALSEKSTTDVVFDNPIQNSMERSFEKKLNDKVISDALDQYYIVERSGDKMQMYVHAGVVAAAYLQAKDEVNYINWNKKTQDLGIELGIIGN